MTGIHLRLWEIEQSHDLFYYLGLLYTLFFIIDTLGQDIYVSRTVLTVTVFSREICASINLWVMLLFDDDINHIS